MTATLGNRDFSSFVVLSVLLHLVAVIAPRHDREPALLEPPAVLVFEMVETAPVTVAAATPPPAPVPPAQAAAPAQAATPPPPPPPTERKPVLPEVVRKTPPPKPAPVAKPAPRPSAPAPSPVASPPAAEPVVAPVPARSNTPAPVAKARYEDQLYAWLARHKEYPVAAQRRGIQGRPVVRVRIDRGGRVVESAIARPSRHTMLDEAAVALVRRAAPFPPIPGDLALDSFEFDAPIDYLLR